MKRCIIGLIFTLVFSIPVFALEAPTAAAEKTNTATEDLAAAMQTLAAAVRELAAALKNNPVTTQSPASVQAPVAITPESPAIAENPAPTAQAVADEVQDPSALTQTAVTPSAETASMDEIIAKPIMMDNTGNEKRFVTFNHNTHESVDCEICHHVADSEGSVYVSCAVDGCHNVMGTKDKSVHSYYQAIHKKGTEKSCVGCHTMAIAENPDLKDSLNGCKSCHKPL